MRHTQIAVMAEIDPIQTAYYKQTYDHVGCHNRNSENKHVIIVSQNSNYWTDRQIMGFALCYYYQATAHT